MSVQKPPNDRNYAMALLSRDLYFGSDEIIGYRMGYEAEGEVVEIDKRCDDEPFTFPTKVVQWLDEQDLADSSLNKTV